jgi:diguanylate cyclase (GGDEF)-like protein/PAS domain S-box-containing protein
MDDENPGDTGRLAGNNLFTSLRLRFLFWVSIVLLTTLGATAYYVYNTQQTLLAKSVRSKVDTIGRFIALISPQAIYTFDITTLDRYMSQISNDTDVRFAQIRSPGGLPMTTYLPPDMQPQQLERWISQFNTTDKNNQNKTDPITIHVYPIIDNAENLGHVLVGLDTGRMIEDTRQAVLDLITIFALIVFSLGALIIIIFKLHVLNPLGVLKDGAMRIAEGDFTHQMPIYSEDELGHLAKSFNNMMDKINRDRQALLSANHELTKLSLAVEQSPAAVVITDLDGRIEYVNPKYCEVSGYRQEELIGRETHILGDELENSKEQKQIWDKLLNGELWKGEFNNQRKNGRTYWESAVITPIRDPDDGITHFLAVKEDITARKAFEKKLLEQATHDQLTGLPNRFLAIDRLQQMLQHAYRQHSGIGIIYIDLDNFKTINDSLGHATGDDLLVQVSTRIWTHLRDEDTLCRLGGDEFMALVPNLKHPVGDLKVIINRVIASLQSPFDLGGHKTTITSSLGIALYPEDGNNVSTLMSNADIAMYEAKRSGRNTFRFFTRDMNERIQSKIALESQLKHAFETDKLYPVYHPIIRLADGALVGAEILLRWDNSEMDEITPSEFIPVAEQTGLIRPITDWLLNTILEHAKMWRQRPESFWLAVNVPPSHFCEEPFRRNIDASAQKAARIGLDLCIEITENLFLQNGEEALDHFRHLAQLGVTTAMDDFGTGYSSLAYVKRFPLNFLKIDRTFIGGLPDDPEDRSLTEIIVLMGHRLGISIIAEGVETQEQLDYLRSLDVEYAQGFHIAEPMKQKAFKHYLTNNARH